jgi:hypothetical protein
MEDNALINNLQNQDGGAATPPQLPFYVNQNYDVLLQIIDEGINRIIIDIKNQLGDTHANFDSNVNIIIRMLENINGTAIQPQIPNIPSDNEKINYKGTNINNLADTNSNSSISIKYLDVTGKETTKLDAAADATPQDIQNRLNNCQILEMLYLIKHEELLKTFNFAVEIFNKYKYAIKILLYILKKLVNKNLDKGASGTATGTALVNQNPQGTDNIKLPKVIITNIQQLLREQQNIQNTINAMKPSIENQNLNNILDKSNTLVI